MEPDRQAERLEEGVEAVLRLPQLLLDPLVVGHVLDDADAAEVVALVVEHDLRRLVDVTQLAGRGDEAEIDLVAGQRRQRTFPGRMIASAVLRVDDLQDLLVGAELAVELLHRHLVDAGELLRTVDADLALGAGVIAGVTCDHLAFRTDTVDWQIFVAQGDRPFPCIAVARLFRR